MNAPIETSEVLAFAKTVDAKSLSRAAAELGVPRATISRRLARLEEQLGVRLLRRTTRSLVLTDAGDAFYRHARIVLDAVRVAEASVRKADDVVRGPLRVSLPPISDPSLHAMICDFARRYPQVQLQLLFSTQLVDLRRDGYDVALRASTELEPGLVARSLVRMKAIAVASPSYLAAHGTPTTRRDLRNHRCLMGFARGELPQTQWPLAGGGKVQVEGVFCSNDMPLLVSAALAGLGIAVLPSMNIEDAIKRGELVHVLAGIIESEARVALVYPERELMLPQVRAFVDAVAEWARTGLRATLPVARPARKARGSARTSVRKLPRKTKR